MFMSDENVYTHVILFLQCAKTAPGSAGVCAQKTQSAYSVQTQTIEESYRGKVEL